MFFQASLLRSAANKSAKNKPCCNRFSSFCEVRIMISRYFRGSGQPVLSILRISEKLSDFSVFGDLPAAKNYSLFGTKIETRTNFSWSCSLLFLGCSFFQFFMIWGARRLFGFLFSSTLRALGLWENSWKCCKGCQFQRFDPFQTESFCRSWLWVSFDDEFFGFVVILSCFGAPILAFFRITRG